MTGKRFTLRRAVVVSALVVQAALTLVLISRNSPGGLSDWARDVARGTGDALSGAAAVAAVLFLTVPSARGRRWALPLSAVVQVGLMLGILPYLVASFAHPRDFSGWTINVSYFVCGALGAAFGVVASFEAFGRAIPRCGAGISAEGAALLVVASVWAGMVAVGGAVSSAPNDGAAEGIAQDVVVVRTGAMWFVPRQVPLAAGKATAIVLVNESSEAHSFDVDPLGIHVRIPASSTTVTVVPPLARGELAFYCGLPGHAAAGMVGILDAH